MMATATVEPAAMPRCRHGYLYCTQCDPELAGIGEWQQPEPQSRAGAVEEDLPSRATGENWPEPLRAEAYQGLAGELVRAIEPHSEADPAALLVQLLAAFGNAIGRGPHMMIESDYHPCNLFVVQVGRSAKGRKGTAWGRIKAQFLTADKDWCENRMMGGLSSGEGLIWAVRDPIHERHPIREKGRTVGHEDVESDPGVADKRLLVVEPEFARVLAVIEREANTLSAIIRQAWDTGDLGILTKKQTARATGAYVSIIGHITSEELRRLLTDTAIANGFANRFLWVCVQRSKLLPFGGKLHTVNLAPLNERLCNAIEFARPAGRIDLDTAARAIWERVYPQLTGDRLGMFGCVASRAEPQTLRLAVVYALLDLSAAIRQEHLLAALEVWRYCEDSARFIFGDALGDSVADEILRELRRNPDGLTRTEIRDVFQRNKHAADIGRALGLLQRHGLARVTKEQDGQGRPAERWFALLRATT